MATSGSITPTTGRWQGSVSVSDDAAMSRGRSSPLGRAAGVLLISVLLSSCGTVTVRSPVPTESMGDVAVLGHTDLRYFVGRRSTPLYDRSLVATMAEPAIGETGPDVHVLGISGGGANGAFAGGLLSGWTRTGTRPEFDVVSGVSTGALAAPFAFLGSDYDELLRHVYTTTSTRDVLLKRRLLSAFRADSAADSEGLRRLVEANVDRALLSKIAAGHASGRRLYVSTTDLDAGEAVIWDMGRIASLDDPRALDLFRSVLVASASIPVAFSPVYIPVTVDGRTYDEMHVDGGATAQVFVLPRLGTLEESNATRRSGVRTHIWVIRNSRLIAEPMQTEPSIREIAKRSLDVLVKSQGVGDLYRIYALARQRGAEFNVAYIPDEFRERAAEAFDPEYMRRLFDFGANVAISGSAWRPAPPGLERADSRATSPPP